MILLAGVSTRAMLESAVKAGFSAISVDYFADGDAQKLGKVYSLAEDFGLDLNTYNLVKAAKMLPCTDFVYASGPEHRPEELFYWEEKGLLRGNTPQVVKEIRNPWRLREVLADIEISLPAFYHLDEWFDQKACAEDHEFLLKPLHRGGGSGIIALPKGKEQQKALLEKMTDIDQYVIQAYVKGLPASVTFLADGQEALVLGTSRQLISQTRGRFSYAGNIVPLSRHYSVQIPRYHELLIKMVNHLTKVFGLRGLNTLDFMISTEGIRVLEVNPRWSGSVELFEKQLNISLFAYHIDPKGVTRLRKEQGYLEYNLACRKEDGFWGKQIVYASEVLKVRNDLEISSLMEQGMRDIPSPGTVIQSGQPLCTVFAQGDTEEDCLERLREKEDWAIHILQEQSS